MQGICQTILWYAPSLLSVALDATKQWTDSCKTLKGLEPFVRCYDDSIKCAASHRPCTDAPENDLRNGGRLFELSTIGGREGRKLETISPAQTSGREPTCPAPSPSAPHEAIQAATTTAPADARASCP